MKLFVTGATGYIGRVVTERLHAAGHRVIGLARSEESAQKLKSLGAEAVRGDLRDGAALESAAQNADGAIHLAMEMTAEAPALDRDAIDAILAGLGSSGKPFVYTSGVWVMGSTGGHTVDENTPVNPTPLVAWRPAHERFVLTASGVRGVVIRPAMVYGRGGGIVGTWVGDGRKGAVRFVGTGENRWPFVHVDDLADLYVLALHAAPGSLYFAADGPSIPVKEIAERAAAGAPVHAIPLEEARKTMGPLADALTLDQLVSGRKAWKELGWAPKGRSIVEELTPA